MIYDCALFTFEKNEAFPMWLRVSFLLVLLSINLSAQNFVNFNQFYGTSIWQNPSLTGIAGQSRVQSSMRFRRTQGFNSFNNSYYISAEVVNDKLPLDIGFIGLYDDYIIFGLEELQLGLSISRAFKFPKDISLRLGVSSQFIGRSQLLNNATLSGSAGILNAGFTLTGSRFVISYSALSLNRPIISMSDNFILKYQVTHNLNASFQLWKSDPEDNRGFYASVLYFKSEIPSRGVNLIYRQKRLKCGIGYFIPKKYCIYLGASFDKFSLNYSYQLERSTLTNLLVLDHQFSFALKLGNEVERARGSKLIQSLF
jgi:Type IX secretion system membrane protein PorP/SprF